MNLVGGLSSRVGGAHAFETILFCFGSCTCCLPLVVATYSLSLPVVPFKNIFTIRQNRTVWCQRVDTDTSTGGCTAYRMRLHRILLRPYYLQNNNAVCVFTTCIPAYCLDTLT